MSTPKPLSSMVSLANNARSRWALLAIGYLPAALILIFLTASAFFIWRARETAFDALEAQIKSTEIVHVMAGMNHAFDLAGVQAQDSLLVRGPASSRQKTIDVCRALINQLDRLLEGAPVAEKRKPQLILLKSLESDFESLVTVTKGVQGNESNAAERATAAAAIAQLRQRLQHEAEELTSSLQGRHEKVLAHQFGSRQSLQFFQYVFVGCSVLFVAALFITGRSLARYVQAERVQAALQQSYFESANQADLKAQQSLLDSIQYAQSAYIASGDLVPVLDGLVIDLLRQTRSDFGFISEVQADSKGKIEFGSQVVRDLKNGASSRHSISETSQPAQEFAVLEPAIEQVVSTRRFHINNEFFKIAEHRDSSVDQPVLRSLLVLPISHGNELIGLIGLGNRLGGYDSKLADFLRPVISTCGKLFYACSNERRQRRADLERQKFVFLVEHSSDGIGMATLDGIMFFLNPAGRRIVGFSTETPINLICLWDFYYQGGERFFHDTVLPSLQKTGRWEGEVLMRNQETQESVPVFQNLFLVSSDDQSEPLYLAVANRDISESKKSERALNQAKEDAEAANRAKSEFLANMSHEVRTPMVAILGFADMLLDKELQPEERRRAVINIARNGNHLLQVINDILDLSKIEAGKLMLEFVSYSPWQIVTETLSALRVRNDEKRAKLTAAPSGKLPSAIMTDPRRVRQILFNLVSNALKFTSPERKVELNLSMDETGKVLCFDVSDEGIGITESQMGRLFHPFEQGDSSTTRRFGGTGLGLSVSKRLAQMMGGDIVAQSRLGEGSQFIFQFPLDFSKEINWVSAESLTQESIVDNPTELKKVVIAGRGRILLAEDSRDSQIVIKYYLQKVGFEVDIANNGKTAIEMVQKKHYDVILMDMQMPEMDGYTATTTLRGMGCTRPIIALTAHAMRGDREKCQRAGCDDYLTKPVESEILISTLVRFLSSNDSQITSTILKLDSDKSNGHAPLGDLRPIRSIPSRLPSAFCDDNTMLPLIVEYAASLRKLVADLYQAIRTDDFSKVITLAHQTKGASGMYGYPMLSEAAGALEAAARKGANSNELRQYWDVLNVITQAVHVGLQPVK